MTQSYFDSLKEYIVIIEKAVPEDFCDFIINEFKDNEWKEANTITGLTNEIRKCKSIPLSIEDVININKENRENIDSTLFKLVGFCISEYKKTHPNCLINKDSGYDLLKYENGDFYKEHIDEYTDVQRVLSMSIALNDDYDGGEFSFFSDTVNFKLNKGDVIIFPSNFMFPHQIKTIENGTRYSIVSWIY
jgi:hypothetical protein